MNPVFIISAPADQGGPQAYAKELILPQNCDLESLTWVNKGTDNCYIQLFDAPRSVTAIAITDTDMATGLITAAAHGFVTGDKVTFSGIATLTTHYVNAASSSTLYAYSTRALALAGGTPDVLPDADNDTGTCLLASIAASAPVPEEYPCLPAASAPANLGSFTNARFRRGLYVRAVTAVNGSTLISNADIKFTPRYRTGPNRRTPETAYED